MDIQSILEDKLVIYSPKIVLAKIIHPVLMKYRQNLITTACVQDEDVPIEMQIPVNKEEDKEGYYTSPLHGDRWRYVLDNMIFAFEKLSNCDTSDLIRLSKEDNARIDNGLRLFGKYYQDLWN